MGAGLINPSYGVRKVDFLDGMSRDVKSRHMGVSIKKVSYKKTVHRGRE